MILESIPEKKRNILQKKGIASDIDLAYLLPYKFYDFSHISDLVQENVGKYVCCAGVLDSVKKKSGAGRSTITAKVITENGRLSVTFIGQAFMEKMLEKQLNETVFVCGKLQYSEQFQMYSMLNPIRMTSSINAVSWHTVYPKYRNASSVPLI